MRYRVITKLLLATRNRGKIDELQALLSGTGIEVFTLDDFPDAGEVEEDANTLEGNARKKALELHVYSGLATLADDTGLEVDALDGDPGVFSSRYSGPEGDPARNRAMLLRNMNGLENRRARFRTVVAVAEAGKPVQLFEGVCEGRIAGEERGRKGFGYDSIFIPAGLEQTFAELDPEGKNAISHRGKAVRSAVAYIAASNRKEP